MKFPGPLDSWIRETSWTSMGNFGGWYEEKCISDLLFITDIWHGDFLVADPEHIFAKLVVHGLVVTAIQTADLITAPTPSVILSVAQTETIFDWNAEILDGMTDFCKSPMTSELGVSAVTEFNDFVDMATTVVTHKTIGNGSEEVI